MSTTSTATVSLTTAFIDLSTFDEIECWLYGGKSVNRFRKVIRKSAWFTVIASQLNRLGTVGDFNTEIQAMFSRSGDYIRDLWVRVTLPEVQFQPGYQGRWTRNIGHNLIEEAYLQFNDLTVNKLTSQHIDFITAFLTPEGKQNGYGNMIGNIPFLTNPYAAYARYGNLISNTASVRLPAWSLNIPLPFWFCRDNHDAIIQAACPFNDIKVSLKIRAWQDLLVIDQIHDPNNLGPSGRLVDAGVSPDWTTCLVNTNLHLTGLQVWAHYAVIPNGDREKIADEPDIDQLIEQVQTIPATSWSPAAQRQRGVDLRFAHSIRALFFAMRRTDVRGEWSNYSTHAPRGDRSTVSVTFDPMGMTDPIARAILTYENVDRVNMPADYYTMVAPYYSALSIPLDTGYHLLSYANKLDVLQPDGSTNFARLASVNLNIEASDTAVFQSTDPAQMPPNTQEWDAQWRNVVARYDIIITASSLSILRFSGGSAGFPVL